jgi:hypothetical protein
VPKFDEGLKSALTGHACSGRFRLERSPGGACTHWKSAALSRRTWKADIRTLAPPDVVVSGTDISP